LCCSPEVAFAFALNTNSLMINLPFVLNSTGRDEMRGQSINKFDVVIIDEAAQATEPACWVQIIKGKKLPWYVSIYDNIFT
jgi:hypothetical protein